MNWKPWNGTQPFSLTDKEIGRSVENFDGRRFAIVSRPTSDGNYFVGAVWLDTGFPVSYASYVWVPKSEVSKAVREVNRWMDKMGGSGGLMSDRSRRRASRK